MDNYMLVRVFLILLAAITLFVLVSKYSARQKLSQSEKFFDDMMPLAGSSKTVEPADSANPEGFKAVNMGMGSGDCFPKDKLTAEDLLPKDAANSAWAKVNPAGQGDVKDQNFLQAGYHVGLNTTQGNTRNGNLQFRSEPPNPQSVVSPWMNSTIGPDVLRKPLEVGDEC